jgi:hypothetical protein
MGYLPDWAGIAHCYWLPPENDESFRSHHHEPGELVTQDPLNVVGLLDRYAESDRVDRGLNQHPFRFISGYDQWV